MTLEIKRFLADVTPDNACGDDLQYDPAFIALEQAIKGKPEQQIGDTILEAEPPNWKEVRKNAEELLLRSKDLRVLISLLRAWIVTDGLSGFSSGLTLIKELVEQQWDGIHPQLDPDDDNDPTERVNILMSLCDQDTILRPLQLTPLIQSKAVGKFSLRDIQIANGKISVSDSVSPVGFTTIEAAVQDANIDAIRQDFDDVVSAFENINSLENFITEQVGINKAANFDDLRNLLKEVKVIMTAWLESRGAGVDDNTEDENSEADTDGKDATARNKSKLSGGINNHQDVLAAIKQICDFYKKYEPSSPVPLLMERCARLVGKSFLDVLMDIAPDGVDQANVIMGIRDESE